ncbi:MAG TPA: winged helix-turn-helix domain-containing protein [Acidimicrobiales bacterium]|nr:winged helix-turn-helix domain-containing protein [Acidimicrobiales bacterium]
MSTPGPRPDAHSKRLLREKLAVISDPLRTAIVSSLARTPASAAKVAEELGEDPQRVRYLLRRMRGVGLVDSLGKTKHQGVRENLYSVDPARLVLSIEEVTQFTPQQNDRAVAAMVRLMFREVSSVIRSTPSAIREDFFTRLPVRLDPQGWDEAAALHAETMSRVLAAGERSRERLTKSNEEPIRTLAMVLFVPLQPSPGAGSSGSEDGR